MLRGPNNSKNSYKTTTQSAVVGPKTFWEDQRAWRPKNLAAQRAKRTKVLRKQTTGRTKKIFNKQMGHRKIKYFIENRD